MIFVKLIVFFCLALRLDLLDSEKQYYLRKSLNGLLMLLPQGEAFHLLRKRLQCVSLNTFDQPKELVAFMFSSFLYYYFVFFLYIFI